MNLAKPQFLQSTGTMKSNKYPYKAKIIFYIIIFHSGLFLSAQNATFVSVTKDYFVGLPIDKSKDDIKTAIQKDTANFTILNRDTLSYFKTRIENYAYFPSTENLIIICKPPSKIKNKNINHLIVLSLTFPDKQFTDSIFNILVAKYSQVLKTKPKYRQHENPYQSGGISADFLRRKKILITVAKIPAHSTGHRIELILYR
jgi:hypothetical protein